MTAMNNRIWVVGGFVLSAVILLAGWFLGTAPVLGQAAAADSERVAVADKNAIEQVKLDSLRERSAGLDSIKTEVARQRVMLPADADIATLIGQLNAMQQASGVVLTDFAVSDGVLFEPPTIEEDVPAEDPASEEGEAATTLAADAESAPGPSVPEIPNAELVSSENFVAVPVSVSATGNFDQLLSFVENVQSGERLFLVTEFSVGEDEQNITFKGTLTGYVYVLVDPTMDGGTAEQAAASIAAGAGAG